MVNELIENRLLALEEARTFFGASLKFPDMFRLVSSRINELIPFASCAFFLARRKRYKFKNCLRGRRKFAKFVEF